MGKILLFPLSNSESPNTYSAGASGAPQTREMRRWSTEKIISVLITVSRCRTRGRSEKNRTTVCLQGAQKHLSYGKVSCSYRGNLLGSPKTGMETS